MWPGFRGPLAQRRPAFEGAVQADGAWGIPAINTLLLLSSGVTVTWALGAQGNNRKQLIAFLALTVLLGVLFLGLQALEYGTPSAS